MNNGDDKLVYVLQGKCLCRLLLVHRSEQVRTEDLLERAQMKSLREDWVIVRRWKMIGHRQDQANDGNFALTWAPEGRR